MKLNEAQMSAHYNDKADIITLLFVPRQTETTIHYIDLVSDIGLLIDGKNEIVGFQIEGWQWRNREKLEQIRWERDTLKQSWNDARIQNEDLRNQNECLRKAIKELL